MEKLIHNVETGQITTELLTEQELAEQANIQNEYEIEQAEAEAKAAQRAALLDRLGITEDEAKLLLA